MLTAYLGKVHWKSSLAFAPQLVTKRSRKVAELEEEVRQLKRKRIEQEKEIEKLHQGAAELESLKQWLEEKEIVPPLFVSQN